MTNDKNVADKEGSQAEVRSAAPQEVQDVKKFLQTHGVPVAIGVCLAAAAVLALVYRQNKAEMNRLDASTKLFSARSVQDISQIVDQQASTPIAPLALLRLAKIQFDSGNFDAAMARYNEFKTKHPQHEFVEAAELGGIHCIEARGAYDEAETAFAAFISKNPKHFLTPEAIFGQARSLEQLGRYKEARALYEDFLTANPESGWQARAKELLDNVSKTMKEGPGPDKQVTVTDTNLPASNLEMPAPR